MFMPHGKAFGAPRSSSFPALPVSLSSQSNGSHRGLNKQPVHKLPTGQIAINKPSNVQQGWMTEAVRSVYVCVRLCVCVLSLTSFKSNPQHLFLSLVHPPKMLLLVLKLTAFFCLWLLVAFPPTRVLCAYLFEEKRKSASSVARELWLLPWCSLLLVIYNVGSLGLIILWLHTNVIADKI